MQLRQPLGLQTGPIASEAERTGSVQPARGSKAKATSSQVFHAAERKEKEEVRAVLLWFMSFCPGGKQVALG